MPRLFQKVVIIGVGLIGGSIGMALRKKRLARIVIGVGPDARALKKAVSLKAIDRYQPNLRKIKQTVQGADLVILATPVGEFEKVARRLVPVLPEKTIVTDVGSVKGPMVRSLERLFSPSGGRFVGGHPVAGREKSGAEAASATLFSGALCILTPTPQTSPRTVQTVRRLWKAIGAQVVLMDPNAHDRILAAVSHLPHVIAYALVNTVLEIQSRDGDLLRYAAGGFKDFTRVAASSSEMWRDICLANRENVVEAIEAYEKTLRRLKRLLIRRNAAGLRTEFRRARKVKTRIKPI